MRTRQTMTGPQCARGKFLYAVTMCAPKQMTGPQCARGKCLYAVTMCAPKQMTGPQCARGKCLCSGNLRTQAMCDGVSERQTRASTIRGGKKSREISSREIQRTGFKLVTANRFSFYPSHQITTTNPLFPTSFEQTQRVPTGHPDVCLCDVSGATN